MKKDKKHINNCQKILTSEKGQIGNKHIERMN